MRHILIKDIDMRLCLILSGTAALSHWRCLIPTMNRFRPLRESQSRHATRRILFGWGTALLLAGSTHGEMAPSYLPPADEVIALDKFQVTGQSAEKTYAIQRSFTATKTDT